MADYTGSEEMGRFSFDGAEDIAFWVSDHDPELEHNVRVMFGDLETLKGFLEHNFPGLFTALDGATNEPAPEYRTADAGEFAAKWNAMSPEHREYVWKHFMEAQDLALKCFMEDHEGALRQVQEATQKINHAKSEIGGLLDSLDSHITQDEIYSALKAIQEAL